MNTTQMMANLVSNVIQPSDKSSFNYVPKYFKPNQGSMEGKNSFNNYEKNLKEEQK